MIHETAVCKGINYYSLYFLKFSACSKTSLYTSSFVTGGYLCLAKVRMISTFSSALMSSRSLQSVYFALSSTMILMSLARAISFSSVHVYIWFRNANENAACNSLYLGIQTLT